MSDRRKSQLRFQPEDKGRMKDSDYQKEIDRRWGKLDYEKEWRRTNWEDVANWDDDDDDNYQYYQR
jgi:hypothetical protein